MALTVRALAAQPELGVRIVAGTGAADRPITWVHVSELNDPTPFLSGGELLLTTGLFVRPDVDLDQYVNSLCRVGVLGLGFGVGLSFQEIPGGLVSAADRMGLPVLEVPRRTPFIALSRAVSRALAADEYAAVTRTFTAQQELTRAALSPQAPDRLILLLARKVDGWVVLVDGRGEPVASGGHPTAGVLPAVAMEVARLREHRGSVGVGFEVGRDSVSLQPVGTGRPRRAYLAVGRPGPLTASDRHLVNTAVVLLTLGFEQDAGAAGAVASVNAAALELALAGHLDLARSVLARVGSTFPDDPVVVIVALSRSADRPAARSADDRFAGTDQVPVTGPGSVAEPAPAAEFAGELVVVASAAEAAAAAERLVHTGRMVGLSAPTSADRLARAREQARHAADDARDRGEPIVRFDAMAAAGIARLWKPALATAFAESLLAPLIEHDRAGRGDLVASLQAWLARHGQWDPAAAALGVHRHTLRRRMGLAGELLGRDLDSPTVRSELWLALTVAGPSDDRSGPVDRTPPLAADPPARTAERDRSRR